LSLETILVWTAAGGYALATATAGLLLVKPRNGGERWVIVLLALSLLPHAAALIARTVALSAFPIASVHDGLVAMSLLSAAIAVLVAWRGGVPQVALLSAPLITVLMIASALVPPSQTVPEGLRSTWLGVHIGLALLGDSAIAVAGVVSLVYLVQERRLKQKKRPAKGKIGTGLHNLPALEILDRVSVQLIKFGFPLMTLGLLSGALYGKQVWGKYWTWDPRNTVSLMVWILYAVMLQARLVSGWRGRKAAILTVVGVIAILIAFVGLGLAGVGTHEGDYVS
jgi:cytochrome c-type biogenesis protein CcsB